MTDRLFLKGPQNLLAITVNGSVIVESEEERQRSGTGSFLSVIVLYPTVFHVSGSDSSEHVKPVLQIRIRNFLNDP